MSKTLEQIFSGPSDEMTASLCEYYLRFASNKLGCRACDDLIIENPSPELVKAFMEIYEKGISLKLWDEGCMPNYNPKTNTLSWFESAIPAWLAKKIKDFI